MLKIIIIDDEKIAIEELAFVLSKDQEVEIVGKYTDVKAGIESIRTLKPDAVFLDISMPGINGFIAAEEFKKLVDDIQVVFVTAHDKYAIKAFELDASDYILKPFSEERILLAINRLRGKKETDKDHNHKILKKLPVWKKDSLMLINIEEILFCYVKEGSVYIVTESQVYTSEETLAQVEIRLKQFNFIKCHRNYIVNLECITNIVPWINGTFILKLNGTDEEIPVSRNYNKAIRGVFHI
ncbi:LytR/AlgR family response regulator transcription factor [Clostridium manihotivorum]|uniref:Stage 0 sporulation protein A homolog n=1 Tax=Clostridium manihotivorum TaxID=2320868 RepID=A0A3R5X0I3_9CLOT|nr:LytTR family DNA-binding domain-containing protein [Clostridium manihotivorum]QAA31279.1 LytTR family transcriptional regulator [Clostridium manihotivorum]